MHWLRFNFLRGYLYNTSSRTYNFLKITALIPQQLSDKMSHCSIRIHHSASQIWHKLLIHVKLCMYIPLSSQWVNFIFAKLMMIPFCLLSSPTSFFLPLFFLRTSLQSVAPAWGLDAAVFSWLVKSLSWLLTTAPGSLLDCRGAGAFPKHDWSLQNSGLSLYY